MATPKELVQALYEAFGRGDAETVLGALHPSVEWNEAEGGPLAVGNPYVGPQAVGGGVFGPLIRDLADYKVSPREFVAEGEDVVAFGRYTGTHRETGHALAEEATPDRACVPPPTFGIRRAPRPPRRRARWASWTRPWTASGIE